MPTEFDNAMRQIAYELMQKHAPEFLSALKRDLKHGVTAKEIERRLKRHDLQNKHITIQSAILAVRYMHTNPATYQE
jgi:hypothetical protein